jgi:dienelactone hydrolase
MYSVGACASLKAIAQQAISLPRDYSKCLPAFLSSLAGRAYRRRVRHLSRLSDAAAIHDYQSWARKTFWHLIGGEPERTPLNIRYTTSLSGEAFAVEKLAYESRPGVVISANLYIPKTGKPPYPGVLFQMGHAADGKAYEPYQRCCQGLVQLGYVVLAFDPMGQGERVAYPDASGLRTRLSSVDEEHSLPGKQMLLVGDSAARYQLWDAVRSMDLLASHPLVDPLRLASTGQSGGGTLTMMLACVDQRLSAAVVCSGNTEDFACARFNAPGSTDDAEQDLVGSGPMGFDRWDLLYPFAPKALLIQVSAHDSQGTYSPRYLEDGREQYQRLADVYRVLRQEDRLAWRATPLPHGLTLELRLGIYNWFERWLKKSEMPIDAEPAATLYTPEALWAGSTGSVFRDFGGLRPFEFTSRAAALVNASRSQRKSWEALILPGLPAKGLRLKKLISARLDGARVWNAEVNSAPDVWVPIWLFIPERIDHGRAALLALDDRGRNAESREGGLWHRLARGGQVVCVADVRGKGDMRPEVGRGNPGYTIPHASEEDFAWASLMLGAPLLTQRVADILACVEAMRNDEILAGHSAGHSVAIAARGDLCVPSLFAFAGSTYPGSLYLANGLISFQNLLETEAYNQTLANFSWNLFRLTDLPLLAAQSHPRRIHLAGPVNAEGKVMDVAAARAIYLSANVSVSAPAAWDEAAFAGLV